MHVTNTVEGDAMSTARDRDASQVVYETPELLERILGLLSEGCLRRLIMPLDRAMLSLGHRHIAQRRSFSLAYVDRLDKELSVHRLFMANIRSIHVDQPLEGAKQDVPNYCFKPQDLQKLVSKLPGLRDVHRDVERRTGLPKWKINIPGRIVTKERRVRLDPGRSEKPDGYKPAEESWGGYGVTTRITLDVYGVASKADLDRLALVVRQPAINKVTIDLDPRSTISTTELAIATLSARQACQQPLERYYSNFHDPPTKDLRVLTDLCAKTCGKLTFHTYVYHRDGYDGEHWYEITAPDGESEGEDDYPGDSVHSVSRDTTVEVVYESERRSGVQDIRNLATDVGSFLRTLCLGQSARESDSSTRIGLEDMADMVDLIRASMSALRILSLILAVYPDSSYLSDRDCRRSQESWGGQLEDIELELWDAGNGSYAWGHLPVFSLAHNLACIVSSECEICVWVDDDTPTGRLVAKQLDAMSPIAMGEFGDLVKFFIELPEKRQANIRKADFGDLGLWPNKRESVSWRDLVFDADDEPVPVTQFKLIDETRLFRQQAEDGRDGWCAT